MHKLISVLILLSISTLAFAKRGALLHLGKKYVLVTPDVPSRHPRPIIVLLHGCLQDPDLILEGTGLEEEALKNNFMILVPQQSRLSNIDHCWNWFLPFEQMRFPTNEMGQIVSALDIVTKTHNVDRNKTYVTGISAGGALAHNLSVCYPDIFTASAIHSGINFKAAEGITEARPVLTSSKQKSPAYLAQKMALCSGPASKGLKKILVIHGDEDRSVLPLHADLMSRTHAIWRDYLDDGVRNDSDRGTSSTLNIKFTNGYEVEKTVTEFSDFLETKLIVKGLPHAWSGGKPVSVHFEPKGPSSTKFILEFFGITK